MFRNIIRPVSSASAHWQNRRALSYVSSHSVSTATLYRFQVRPESKLFDNEVAVQYIREAIVRDYFFFLRSLEELPQRSIVSMVVLSARALVTSALSARCWSVYFGSFGLVLFPPLSVPVLVLAAPPPELVLLDIL
ncbi:hypothetical protein BJX70DRAFT_383740 [Aspergillus crustosus]